MRVGLAWLVATALSLVAVPADAATVQKCAVTDEAPPKVVTFMASKTKPVTEGWIVQPSCAVEVTSFEESSPYSILSIYNRGIERVVSVPSGVMYMIDATGNPLSLGADFSAATNVTGILLSSASPALTDNLVLPKSVTSLAITYSAVTSIDKVKLPGNLRRISLNGSPIQSIDGVVFPDSLQELSLTGSSITSIDNAKLPPNLKTLELGSKSLTSIDKAVFPESLESLSLEDTSLKSVDDVTFPPYLTTLIIRSQNITSLKKVKFSSRLKELRVSTSAAGIDFEMPPKLAILDISNYAKPSPGLERIKLPSMLTYFGFYLSETAVVRGIKWPSSIQQISLAMWNNFEIRESDLPIFQSMRFEHVYPPEIEPQPNCTDPTAVLTMVNQASRWWMCVISDERFETLYGDTTSSPSPSTTSSPSAAGSTTAEGDGSAPTDQPPALVESSGSGSVETDDEDTIVLPNGSKATRKPSSKTKAPRGASTVDSQSSAAAADSNQSSPASRRSNSTRIGTQSGTTAKTPGASNETEVVHVQTTTMHKTMVVAASVAGGVLLLMLTCCGFRGCISKRSAASKDDYNSLDTPSVSTDQFSSSGQGWATASLVGVAAVANDVRNDQLLLPFRLKQGDIVLKEPTGKLGPSEIFHGSYQGRGVAVKRIQSAFTSDEQVMSAFMDDIRMCASLDHPKIVAFVGIAWTDQRDLSVLTELMAGGDLESFLYSQPQASVALDWFAPWTTSQIKSKTAIAMDVVEALAYLHAFNVPILHRDIRARNVVLDDQGNAKLDSLAISRNTSVDKTMRGEIGSAAWVAPEVLLGEEPTEKADIYALGVLLVELDCCRPPYSGETLAEDSSSSGNSSTGRSASNGIVKKNVQIAVQVCAGELRPTVSSACPAPVAALASSCMAFNATDRPSANEVIAALKNIQDTSVSQE